MARRFGSESGANYGTLQGEANGFSQGDPFKSLNDTVSRSVMTIKQNTQSIVSLERQIGTSKDSNGVRRRIQNLIKSTLDKVLTSKQQLSELVNIANRTGDKGQQLAAKSIRETLNSSASNFNTVMERVIEKLREHPQPPRMSTPVSGFMDSGDLEVQGDKAHLVRSQQQAHQQQLVVSTDAAYLEERAERMEALQHDITQLHEIMGEIGQMVVSQGEQIETIERNTEEATTNVTNANTQLDTAVKLKRCSRKLKLVICCIVSVIAAAVLITIIVVIAVIVNNNKH